MRPNVDLLPSLTGMRWVAAFLVFGNHFLFMQFATPIGSEMPQGSDLVFAILFGDSGQAVLSFFFVLSGFVLTWSTPLDMRATEFWQRRMAKIYPITVVTAVIAFFLFGLVHGKWTDWKVVVTNLLLVQSWSPDQAHSLGLNPVLWSLSCEMFFYLFLPPMLILFAQASKRALWTTAIGAVAFTAIVPRLIGGTFDLHQPAPPMLAPVENFHTQFSYWVTMTFPVTRFAEFVLGAAVAMLMLRGVRSRINVPTALVLCVLAFAVNMFVPAYWRIAAVVMVPFAILIAALASADLTGRWSPTRSRLMVWLGNLTFCFYAVHVLFVLFTIDAKSIMSGGENRDFPRQWMATIGLIDNPRTPLPVWGNLLMFLLYLTVAMFAAWVLYRTVELPATRGLRRFIKTPRRTVVPAEAPVSPAPAGAAAVSSAEQDAPVSPAPAGELDPSRR